MRKKLFLAILFLYGLSLAGCTKLPTRVGADYVPSLVEKELQLHIGMELLEDRRPAVDKKFTADIKDVPKEVTDKLIEFFTTTGPVKEINHPPKEDDRIIITGKIHRFMWRSYNKAPTYIPLVNLYVYLGIPCKTAYSLIHLSVELKDRKTGRTIDRFEEYAKIVKNYNLYDYEKVDYAVELQQGFRQVASKIKQKMTAQLRLLNAGLYYRGPIEIKADVVKTKEIKLQPQEIKEEIKKSEPEEVTSDEPQADEPESQPEDTQIQPSEDDAQAQ